MYRIEPVRGNLPFPIHGLIEGLIKLNLHFYSMDIFVFEFKNMIEKTLLSDFFGIVEFISIFIYVFSISISIFISIYFYCRRCISLFMGKVGRLARPSG